MSEFVIKDSGRRQEFPTGAVRDTADDKGCPSLISPILMERLSKHMQSGARKYAARNWEKGMPLSRFFDSAVRHLYQYLEGRCDEDHLAAALFNVQGIMHTGEMIARGRLPKELNDLPSYAERRTFLPQEPLFSPEVSACLDKQIAGLARRMAASRNEATAGFDAATLAAEAPSGAKSDPASGLPSLDTTMRGQWYATTEEERSVSETP